MKRVLLIFLIMFLYIGLPDMLSVLAESSEPDTVKEIAVDDQGNPILPSIFIWQIPDETFLESDDDVCRDSEFLEDDEIGLSQYDNLPEQGYIEYSEYAENSEAISLKKPDKDFVLNLSVPQKFKELKASESGNKIPQTLFSQNVLARSGDIIYNIAPLDGSAIAKKGPFSIGTSYNESIDTSDLGFTTSFFTKYEQKYFSLSSSYNKNAGVSYSDVIDKFSITPELKFNEYISLKDIVTSDITRNRKKNEVVLSVKPSKNDRVRFEFGAGQTYDENREAIRSEVKFSTQFKW